jgi:hypothetical protein
VTSSAQITANRANAQLPTGPKTAAGKGASAQNARTRGLLSVAPVVPHLERAEEWEAHFAATMRALAPADYLEAALAEHVALLLWRSAARPDGSATSWREL